MKQIEYKGLEEEYLIALKLYKRNKGICVPTKKYENLQNKWKNARKKFKKLQKIDSEVKNIIIADDKKIAELFKISSSFFRSNIKEELKNIFNYDSYEKRIGVFFDENADKLNIYSCNYCDSAYAVVYKSQGTKKRTFDIDHFIPKAEYPLFGISLYNFVPSCQVCNSRIKGHQFLDFFRLEPYLNSSEFTKRFLSVLPASDKYKFDSFVHISYIPEIPEDDKNWKYKPLSQKNSRYYKVFFDSDYKTNYPDFIKSFKLEDRYNSIAIKNYGLYLLDLKKQYPDSHIDMLSRTLSEAGVDISPEQIENDIFHKDEKYALLKKLKNDLLE